MLTVEKFSQPYEREAGRQRRIHLIDQLQLSGWRAGSDDVADESPPPHAWIAVLDETQTLRLLHQSIRTPFVSVAINNSDARPWRQAAHSSAYVTVLFITTPDHSGGANGVLQEIAEGRFLYIAMPLRRL